MKVHLQIRPVGRNPRGFDFFCFGQPVVVSGTERYKYIAKELDEGYNVDLYYFGARYYDASLGRFISPDPVRWHYNPYSYSRSNPIMYIDLWGLHADPVMKAGMDYCFIGAAATLGAVFGGTIGSIFPGMGTALGASAGGFLGGLAGTMMIAAIDNSGPQNPNQGASDVAGCPSCPR